MRTSFLKPHTLGRRLAWCLASIVLLSTAGCASQVTELPLTKPRIPDTETECLGLGGNWTRLGLQMRCDVKTADGGKACTDSSECQGACLAAEDTQAGRAAIGKCSPYRANFGGVTFVERGKAVRYNVE